MGPQGSGKTTQGKLLAKKLNYHFISTGELIRNASFKDISKEEWDHMRKGDLISGDLIESLLFPILETEEVEGFVLDGYPRSLEQVANLLVFTSSGKFKLDKAFYVHISREESERRIALRANKEKRPDEDLEVLRHRLSLYHAKTEPILKKYEKIGILREIDGEGSVEEVQSLIEEKV